MELVLNDMSSSIPASNINSGREQINNFVLVCKSAITKGAERSLRTKGDFFTQEVAPGYRIVQWLNDPEVDKEFQRYLRSLAQKAPYIDSEIERELYQRDLCSDFKLDGESVKGLGAAFLLDGLAVSFKSDERWNTSRIHFSIEFIDEDNDDTITIEEIEINHASEQIHLEAHEEWFNIQKLKKIQDGKELWINKELIFPYLIFCDQVQEQISDFHFGQPVFRQIVKRLFEINSYFSTWKGGNFQPELIPCKVTPESKETLKRFEMEHTFKSPDGIDRIFSWHARMTPGPWRLFFKPDEDLKKAIVGYIGLKLPNVSYPK